MPRVLCLLLVLALAACSAAADAPRLDIAAARLERRGDGLWLVADCRWQPSAAMLDGLDHGVALTLDVDVAARAPGWLGAWRPTTARRHRLELRYFPLTRQYQWRDVARGPLRSFAVRSAALSSLERLELPLDIPARDTATRWTLRVGLDTEALPGALRLPALVRPEWRQPPAVLRWTGRAG